MAKKVLELLKKFWEQELKALNELLKQGKINEQEFNYRSDQILDEINKINQKLSDEV